MKKLLIICIVSVLCNYDAFSSHAAGMDITYKYVGPPNATTNLQYEITVAFYRDCQGGGLQAPSDMDIKYEKIIKNPKII